MALDPRYITDTSLLEYFVDKSTGYPLGGGIVSFWEDTARTVPKLVYELTGAPPNYTYTPLPNPIILSSVGTPQNTNGDEVAIYYYPFDALGNLQLYYVTIVNALGEPQFTRQAWPFNDANSIAPIPGGNSNAINNQLKNSQFVAVLFNPAAPYVINIAGAGSYVFPIAPEWNLNVTTTGASTVTVTRTSITGAAALPGNPPYTMTITPGANITSLSVSELLENNPDIWSPQNIASTNGWLNGSILLAPGSSVMMLYAPSQGPSQLILNANNMTGLYTQFNHTVQLAPATNTDNSNVGFVNIVLQLPVAVATTFSNVQVVGLETNVPNIPYAQQTVNLQLANLAYYYYSNLVMNSSANSSLAGWDFDLNPAQFLGPTLAASAAGANTSRYVWDQTIIFQVVNNGPAISRGTNGCFTVTATNTGGFAIIQYLPAQMAQKILNNRNSVNVAAFTNNAGGLIGTVSLWYTTGATLPSCAANNSIVATLNADGSVATTNLAGGQPWSQVPRPGFGNATFTVGPSPNTTNFNDYGFSGWDMQGIAATNTATFFAIVVGFAPLTAASVLNVDSISLNPGNVPARPSVKTINASYADCYLYYQKSFVNATIPAQGVGIGTGESVGVAAVTGVSVNSIGAVHTYSVPLINIPTITLYNPVNMNSQVYDYASALDWSNSNVFNNQVKGFLVRGTSDVNSSPGNGSAIHWVADARLGR